MRFILLFIAVFILNNQTALAQKDLFVTPRQTIHTFLHWQMEGHEDFSKASSTLSIDKKLSVEERIEKVKKLLAILDAKGLMIDYTKIPNNPNYVDSLTNRPQFILFNRLPEVYLVKEDNRWLFSQATIDRIDYLYSEHYSWLIDVVIDELPPMFKAKRLGLEIWQFFALFIWILIGLVLKNVAEFLVTNHVKKLAKKTTSVWDDKLLQYGTPPSGYIFLFLFYTLTYSNLRVGVSLNHFLSLALEIGVILSVIWLIYNLINVLDAYLTELTAKTESKLDDQLVPLIRKSLKVVVVIIGFVFILQNFGYNVASLLAGLGLGGLAFALAAKDTLANFFGSITIFLDKPFQIGDWVELSGQHGIIEEVGFRSTRIRTFENSLLSIPNASMANTTINNYGARKFRRYRGVLNVTYDTPPEKVEAFVEGIKNLVRTNEYTRKDYFEIHFNDFGAHSLDILVYIFFITPDWSTELRQRHLFLLDVYRLADELGVEFAFPTQTVHLKSE